MSPPVPAPASSWLEPIRRAFRGVVDLIYPPACQLCDQPLPAESGDFCPECLSSLSTDPHETCPHCAMTVGAFTDLEKGCAWCRLRSVSFHAALRLGPYDGKLRDAVLRMKSPSGENLAEALAEVFAERLVERLRAEPIHYVVPIPLHWLRRWQRGYNQAETLAWALARRLGVPCRPRWLKRTRNTPSQTRQSETARHENVKGAFMVRPGADVRGKTIVLVDDVMTTGSTCSEAAKALKQAGAARIIVAVLSRSEIH